MKRCDFNNFFNNLKEDTKLYECAAYVFLNCTPKQIKILVEWYQEQNLTRIEEHNGKQWLMFGTQFQYSYPLDEYNNIK